MGAARAVVVNGPRQSGKTALLGLLQAERGGAYVSLDRAADLRSARADPAGFIDSLEKPLFIDEVQRGGDPLVLAVKVEVDRSREKGRFVLAGSTRFLTEPRLSESLAGRVRFVDLWPLSQGEIDGAADGFVDAVFEDAGALLALRNESLSRHQVFESVCRGGFPEAVLADDPTSQREFFSDYGRSLTARDVRELADLEHTASLHSLLRLLAARTGTELNMEAFGRDLGLPAPTLRRYLPLFETIYVHHVVPAWSRNLTAKVVRRPKIHMVDSGLAAYLLGANADRLARPDATVSGQLLESFVAGELARQLTWSETDATLHHWRDRNGAEVDLILEASDGRVVAIEVKSSVDVGEDDFRHLKVLRDRLGKDFVAGVVIHCGNRPRPFGDRLLSTPVNTLWQAAAT